MRKTKNEMFLTSDTTSARCFTPLRWTDPIASVATTGICLDATWRKTNATCESPGELLLLLNGGIVDSCTNASFEGAASSSKGFRIFNASLWFCQKPPVAYPWLASMLSLHQWWMMMMMMMMMMIKLELYCTCCHDDVIDDSDQRPRGMWMWRMVGMFIDSTVDNYQYH